MTEATVDRHDLKAVQRRAMFVLMAFVVAVFVKLVLATYVALGVLTPIGVAIDLLFVLAAFAAVDLFFADMRFRALIILDVFVTLVLLGVGMYSTYYEMLPTRQSLAALGQAAAVSSSIVTLLNPLYLLFFADILLFSWWVLRAGRRGVDPITGRRAGSAPVPGLRTPYVYQRRMIYVAGVVAAAVFIAFVQQARLADLGDGKAIARENGMMTYIVADLIGEKKSAAAMAQGAESVPQIQARIDTLSASTTGAPLAGFTPGQAKGKNVIIIQVEALQAIAVGHSVAGMPVTPNLDALIKDSYYYPNCVSGAGLGTTADVEFVTNTSLYPPPEVGASLGWSDRELTSMPRILNARGYESYTFHTNEVGFWNRSQFYPALGFTRYFDRSYFGTADKMAFNSASDRVLFEKTLPQLKKAQEAGQPFYAQVVMMSSHYPFKNVPSDRRTLRMEAPYTGTITGDYLTEIHYADEQIGYFIAQLKQMGLWDDSIVVVYGDHFGLPEPRNDGEAEALRALAGHDYNRADRLLVPLVIHVPGQGTGMRVEAPVGQVDLVPTLADALDVDLSGAVYFGRSILRSGSRIIAAGGLVGQGSYVDDSVFCVPGPTLERSEVFDVRTREELSASSASEQKFQDAKELVRLSREYVASLPMRQDFDEDAEITFPRKK